MESIYRNAYQCIVRPRLDGVLNESLEWLLERGVALASEVRLSGDDVFAGSKPSHASSVRTS